MSSESDFIAYLSTLPESSDTQSMINYFKNQIKLKKQTLHFKDKFNVIISFIKFIKTICSQANIKIYGSFVRTILEKIFISTPDVGYADPINHDIDIVLYDNTEIFDLDKRNFYDFISLMYIVSNTDKYDFNFNGFKVIDIVEKTLRPNNIHEDVGFAKKFLIDLPHYVIILKKDDIKIKIDLMSYKIINSNFDTWQNEFNINSLTMTQDGIFTKNLINSNADSYNFYETINCIINKTAICNLPFDNLIQSFTYKTRSDKINICNQIIWFFSNRMKILSMGYSQIFSDIMFFDYLIEREEVCQVSGNEPPYIKIKLACNHYISIMALAGLVNIRISEWSESLKCHLCRHDLNFAMMEKPPTLVQIPKQPEKDLETIDNYEIKDTYFSDENIHYITTILKNQSLCIPAPHNVYEQNGQNIQAGQLRQAGQNIQAGQAGQRDNIIQAGQNIQAGQRDNIIHRRPLVGRRTREDYITMNQPANPNTD